MINIWKAYYEEFGMFGIVVPIVIQFIGLIVCSARSFDWSLFLIIISMDIFIFPLINWIKK